MSESGPLSEVIAAYLQAVDAGQAPDREELLARHPELADGLRAFFANQDRMATVAGPLRTEATEAPAAVRSFGDYEVLGELGRGGMGVVYRARQVSLDRVVALKMLSIWRSGDEDDRLEQEARLLATLDHPHVVPVYEIGWQQGQAFFAMKLIEGTSLAERLPDLRRDLREGVRLLAGVAQAVQHAHAKGVLHRDLKPTNIVLDGKGRPYLVDFGLARAAQHGGTLTATGVIVGTPGYLSPEQAAGHRDLTPQTDIWGVGVVLYELLTGQLPFRGGNDLRGAPVDPDRDGRPAAPAQPDRAPVPGDGLPSLP